MDSKQSVATFKRRIASKLADFSKNDEYQAIDLFECTTYRVDRKEFPVPDLILFSLRNIMEFTWTGNEEKVRWTVYFVFNKTPVAIQYRKFGLAICCSKSMIIDIDRMRGQLQSIMPIVEKFLTQFAQRQISEGYVSIINHYQEFNARYIFFRNLASNSYGNANKPPELQKNNFIDKFSHDWNWKSQHIVEGGFYAIAMIDAYFSKIEHQLTLYLAFRGHPLKRDALKSFLLAGWDEKLKTVMPINKKTEKTYAALKRIKERIRNPYSHGGTENDSGSLFVHIPTIGAVPANFSRVKNSVRFNVFPIEDSDHSSVCATFDEFDNIMKSDIFRFAHQLVEAGVCPAYDSISLSNYASLCAGTIEDLSIFIDAWSHEQDKHDNMDY